MKYKLWTNDVDNNKLHMEFITDRHIFKKLNTESEYSPYSFILTKNDIRIRSKDNESFLKTRKSRNNYFLVIQKGESKDLVSSGSKEQTENVFLARLDSNKFTYEEIDKFYKKIINNKAEMMKVIEKKKDENK